MQLVLPASLRHTRSLWLPGGASRHSWHLPYRPGFHRFAPCRPCCGGTECANCGDGTGFPPNEYELVVSGIAAGTNCSDCSFLNNTFILSRDGGVWDNQVAFGGCMWRYCAADPCNSGKEFHWYWAWTPGLGGGRLDLYLNTGDGTCTCDPGTSGCAQATSATGTDYTDTTSCDLTNADTGLAAINTFYCNFGSCTALISNA